MSKVPKLVDDATALMQVVDSQLLIDEKPDDDELCEPAAKRDKNAKKDRCHYCCKVLV